ncbi:polyphosphate kinase 2 [Nitrobacter vulgaris]|jgi:polyphosphate kinase 2|uniref:ADP/GDP-polyphosphate phosphotransferase n=1 Tax=Nitrobacter vulgaris TaxID=29421 RepID=A0A1V4HVG7_NITVU|nr:polyphosphate kinase 2 [Nitrobacter vulgaris]MDR6306080.1 polyphosphate kinase 2 [Nitrobacter vulgaris]OPH81879.1 polyphosphate kinase 2 [Nitrobacter vulgaris]
MTKRKTKKEASENPVAAEPLVSAARPESAQKLSRDAYEKTLKLLQGELVKLQNWVRKSGERIVVVFEGRDAAGKGGVIKALTERVSPRTFCVVALPAPTEREKSEIYLQRYIRHFPAAGEITIFDRSWYNRAGVERVLGFCTDEQYERFLRICPAWERDFVESGLRLVKYWLEVGPDEQTKRFKARVTDPRKTWKLSPMDLESHRRWYDYSRARDAMFAATDTPQARWHVVDADDKRRARLNIIAHFLSLMPYEEMELGKVRLPKRQKSNGYDEPDLSRMKIKKKF